MPEIGEVRIITDTVCMLLKHKLLNSIEILTPGYKQAKGMEQLNSKLPLKVIDVKTKGKFSWIELEDNTFIGYGLGMTGHVRLEPTVEYLKLYNQAKNTNETTEQYLKHAHLRITYIECDGSSKNIFYYHDVRRFGHWDYMERVDLTKKLQSLGSDILQETLPSDMIIKNFRKHNKMNVCKCLMDQRTLAGIGAYIKSEILYMAKINPYSSIKDLSDIDLTNLYYAAKDIAKRAYEAGGASLYTYTGINGDKTDFKNTLQVYGKLTDPHGNSVEKISDADSPDKRATHWVPNIQTIGKPVRIVVNIHKKSN